MGEIASVHLFDKRGNINLHTFEVETLGGELFLLQRLNTDVFNKPIRVMSAMREWIEAQKAYMADGRAPSWTVWEPITLVPTHDGDLFLDLSDPSGWSIWRMMTKIGDTVTFKSLGEVDDLDEQLKLAEEVGRGLALSADLTSPMTTENLIPSLPGYRDTRGYYRQFHSVLRGHRTVDDACEWLPADPEVREATEALYLVHLPEAEFEARRASVQPAIDDFLANETFAYRIFEAMEAGEVRRTAIHGDTKIENFLFCRRTGQVRSLVDLDTIMPFTWLADWGDMVRSLCNVAGERERDLNKVQVNMTVYEAVTRGFLRTAREVTLREIDLMTESVQVITLELGLRFLTDYLRGDNYFMLGPDDAPDLNRVRGLVQLKLYQELRACEDWARSCVVKYAVTQD